MLLMLFVGRLCCWLFLFVAVAAEAAAVCCYFGVVRCWFLFVGCYCYCCCWLLLLLCLLLLCVVGAVVVCCG